MSVAFKSISIGLVLCAISSVASASVTIDGEKYNCTNGEGSKMKVKVTYDSLRPNEHVILKGEKVGRKMVYESQILGFNVELHKQDTDRITLVDNTESDMQKAIYRCDLQ